MRRAEWKLSSWCWVWNLGRSHADAEIAKFNSESGTCATRRMVAQLRFQRLVTAGTHTQAMQIAALQLLAE